MDHKNVIDHGGIIHDGLFNAYDGFLISLNCGASRYEAVRPYEQLDPARVTDAPVSCERCQLVASSAARLSLENVTRGQAAAILALADCAARVPALDNEGLRLALAAAGLVTMPSVSRYGLIREHLVEALTGRALAKPVGVPEVLVNYRRYTGGTVDAPIGFGDRLMYNGIASGIWTIVEVVGFEETCAGVIVSLRDSDGRVQKWPGNLVTYKFSKLDRPVQR
jgi:hypothetical protein